MSDDEAKQIVMEHPWQRTNLATETYMKGDVSDHTQLEEKASLKLVWVSSGS